MGGASDASADAQVTFSPDPLQVGPVTWKVTVTNDTGNGLKLSFTTGQRADVTLTRGGEAVYQWSRGMMFTQSMQDVTVPAGGNTGFTLDEPGLDVDPGEYTLTARVTASNRKDLKVTRQVTVHGR
ncbi:MAG: Intracellular proteinase inhibitor [Actinomycetia bacterium]|nr:Intracellular proteinase inhibitor [Actinomycetes bacterium]